MGSNNSAIFQKGKQYQLNLYQRIDNFTTKYQQEFNYISTELKEKVILLSAHQLVQLLDKRLITSVQLLLIFIFRTSVIGIANNYVFDEMFQEALEMAKQCDSQRKIYPNKISWRGEQKYHEKGDAFPPFYGIPASYKENLKIKGRTSHLGYVTPLEQNKHKQNGLFLEITLKMGFIPFVRTNVPMACKTIQTNNNMFGYSKNPWDENRSCGGSSGGQGGLIGSYCSPIGFGTDIGGSCRIPAQWAGLVTLKPAHRYSRLGNCFMGKIAGGYPIKSDISPISRNVKDQIIFLKFMCDQDNYKNIPKNILDPYQNLKPFSNQIFKTKPKLKIGYFINLETLSCSSSHSRVVKQAVQILRAQGHDVKQVKIPKLEDLYFGLIQVFLAGGNMEPLDDIGSGQPLVPEFDLLKLSTKIPNFVKNWLIWLLSNRRPRMCRIWQNSKKLEVNQTFKVLYDLQQKATRQVYQSFVDNQIDALVIPGFAFPSPKLGTVSKLQYTYSYCTGWNIVNYPAGSVPMGLVSEEEQFDYHDNYNDEITKQIQQNSKGSVGIPVGIQIVSLPYQQQMVLYLMEQIQNKVNFTKTYPCKKTLEKKWF